MTDTPTPFQFVVAVLATWRVAHLIAREDGPFDVIVRLRKLAGDGLAGRVMDCPHCLGLWVAAPFAWWIAPASGWWWFAVWLGIAGGASMAERLVEGGPSA